MDSAAASSTKPKRQRGGRPVVAADAALAARVSAACTHEQRDQLRAAAAACGLTVSEFILRAALGVRVQSRAIPTEWRQVWTDLSPLSSNLHQLIRHLNYKSAANEEHDIDTLSDLLELVPQLAQQLSELRQALVPPR